MSDKLLDYQKAQAKALEHSRTGTRAWLDFYRPHNREDTWYTGEYVDARTGEVVKEPSRTKQSFRDQCDINNIMKQYQQTGMIQHINRQAAQGSYMDLPASVDFQDALAMVKQAHDSFATLPSKVRQRFNNDPAQFLAFLQNPANAAEIVELGLATKPTPPPSPAPQSPPQETPAKASKEPATGQ